MPSHPAANCPEAGKRLELVHRIGHCDGSDKVQMEAQRWAMDRYREHVQKCEKCGEWKDAESTDTSD